MKSFKESLGLGPILVASAVVASWVAGGITTTDAPPLLAQDEPPPIATCFVPTRGQGATPTPPGLYPFLVLEHAELTFTELVGVCVGAGWRRAFEVCVRNVGLGYASPFTVRVQGCVDPRIDVPFPELDVFSEIVCRAVLAEPHLDGDEPCEILVNAECEAGVSGREGLHVYLRLPVPTPPPVCTPGPSPTASPSVTATEPLTSTPSATAEPSTTSTPSPTDHVDSAAVYVPLALANAVPVGPSRSTAEMESAPSTVPGESVY